MKRQDRSDVTWHYHRIERSDRERMLGHKGATVWLTGLSGSGKSTIADTASCMLHDSGVLTAVLDGDNIRHGLNRDLGFSPEDRQENIRRIGEVARLLTGIGIVNFVAFISPYRKDRDLARSIQEQDDFIEVYVDAPLEVAEQRDPKGLYAKARAGEIPSFTGISAPYEEPLAPEIHLHTEKQDPEECARQIIEALRERGIVR
ncbi:adenylyl-sulfate kinase [Candidatus Fermentibacterales bacterium]|nr:adenylyl-sulfate kinase [Candidatus Fermentibacterales bacterium]